MIYLTTGGNGSGKTLFTLADVRKQQLEENRPVYYHGFEPKQPIKDFGWLPFDPEKWQDLPDGSICIFDECQNEFPAKIQGALPDYINAIAQFRRKRGFDFWMITPHPSMINVNVRKLISAPSWHREMKRNFGGDMVSELKWATVNLNCEKPGSSATGQAKMRPYPKEVYDWYQSAVLHTGKKKIPKQVYVLGVLVLVIPLLFWYGFKRVTTSGAELQKLAPPPSAGSQPTGPVSAEMTPAQYVESFTPRIEGLPHTAPRYDKVTEPTTAPVPAACVAMGNRCKCYTQQGTILPTPADICAQIVAGGFFMDFDPDPNKRGGSMAPVAPSKPLAGNPGASPDVQLSAAAVEPLANPQAVRDGEAVAVMRKAPRSASF